GIIKKVSRSQRNIDITGFPDGLTAVHRFDDGKLPGTLLDKTCQPEDILAPVGGFHRGPYLYVGLMGGFYGLINIPLRSFGNGGECFVGSRIYGRQLPSLLGFLTLSVDQNSVLVPDFNRFAALRGNIILPGPVKVQFRRRR